MPVTQGGPAWTWAQYAAELADIAPHYVGYPAGLNIAPQWWTMQANRALFTTTTTTVTAPAGGPVLSGIVTYGGAFNLDGDADLEIVQVSWRPGTADGGSLVRLDFANGAFVGITEHSISGGGNIWELQNNNTGVPLIVSVGLDEGKLGTTVDNIAVAETLIYNPATDTITHTGIFNTSHESTVVDFDHDGDEDILTANWQNPNSGSLVLLRNDGTTLTAVNFPDQWFGPMAIEVVDLDNDGDWELIAADASPNSIGGTVAGERNQVFAINPDNSLTFLYELPVPYFDRDTFEGIAYQPGWEGTVGRSHDIQISAGDIDGDGDQDAVMASMLWTGQSGTGQNMAVFQILINENGVLTDETDARLFNLRFARDASHNFELRDINGDGFLDIVAQGHGPILWQDSAVDTSLTHGNEIYVNDGQGHFISAVGYQLGGNLFSQATFSDQGGAPRWVSVSEFNGNVTVRVTQYNGAFSTGPGLSNPALQGAAGFNEFYYLLNNADVQGLVASGAYASGLAHYLAIGRGEGRFGFAPNATVQGSAGADAITLREGAETAYGLAGADVIVGGAGVDKLYGGDGNDDLNGGLGADILRGEAGDDIYRVDAAGDSAVEDVNAGNDTVYAARSWAVGSNIERVILTGAGNFNVAGNGLANVLKGNGGDNWINGSFGKDTLTGGAGRDSFIFNRTLGPNNVDTITDYDVVRDVIRIDNAVFAGIGAAGALAAGMFNTGAAATQADDRIIYDSATGKLFFDIDGVGGAAQIHFATLSTKPTGMAATEFIII